MTALADLLDRELQGWSLYYMQIDVKILFIRRGDKIAIIHLEVLDSMRRGTGLARRVMTEVCNWADKYGYALALTPSGQWGSDVPRLTSFFASLGFVPNEEPPQPWVFHDDLVRYPSDRGEVKTR